MVSLKRLNDIRNIISKAMYNKKYTDLTSKQSLQVAKKVKQVIKRENNK